MTTDLVPFNTPKDIDKNSLSTKEQEQGLGLEGISWFSYMQLVQEGSKPSRLDGINPGDMIVKAGGSGEPKNLGATFSVRLLSVRGKAQYQDGDDYYTEYLTKFNGVEQEGNKYTEYRDMALRKNVERMANDYQSGLECLFFSPELNGFFTYWANSPTASGAAKREIAPYVGQDISVSSYFFEGRSFQWYKVTSEPVEIDWDETNSPTKEEYDAALNTFCGVESSSEVETPEDDGLDR